MISLHVLDRLQHEINLKAVAQHMGQRFLRVGVQDRVQIEETVLKPHVGDICQ